MAGETLLMPDLLVIGAGLSGLTAALTAAQAGLSVRVIAKGMGALHWSAGTVDVLGYSAAGDAVTHPLAEAAELAPPHPYTLLDADALRDALAWFRAEAEPGGVSYLSPDLVSGSADANLWLPSPLGAKRPAFLVPDAQAAGDLGKDASLLIVGLEGMRDFYPDLIASNLVKQGIDARSARIPVATVTGRGDFNTVHLARTLDDPGARRRLSAALAGIMVPGERVGLPAVLGLDNHSAVLAELTSAMPAGVFEIPTLPPSVPGIRLHRALCRRLETHGVRIETGMDVIGFHAENGAIGWVETETSARPLRHRARAFLLATGGILGGGLTGIADGRLAEDVFDLPLAAPANRAGWFRSEFLDPSGQPIFLAGVEVNHSFQPVDTTGRHIYRNLWAAGGLLAHADPIRERSLEGLAISTGRAAALALVAKLAENSVAT